MRVALSSVLLAFWAATASTLTESAHVRAPQPRSHSSNWAVLVCTSRYWFNYRHVANTLSMYRTVRRLGIPDSNIILMLGDDMACNPRNPFPGEIFNNEDHRLNLYRDDIEVDYRGLDVSAASVLDVLTGRHAAAVPSSKRLCSDSGSNVLVYMAGHGGDGFMKFQDQEELTSSELADALAAMHTQGRYRELLLVVETCQAESLHFKLRSPGILSIAASKVGENSYSHHTDMDVGVAIIDRFTFFALEFFETVQRGGNATMADFLAFMGRQDLQSTLAWRSDLYPKALETVPVTDFFGASVLVEASSARTAEGNYDRSVVQRSQLLADAEQAAAELGSEPRPAVESRRGAVSLDEAALVDRPKVIGTEAHDITSHRSMDRTAAGISELKSSTASRTVTDSASAGECPGLTEVTASTPSKDVCGVESHEEVDGGEASNLSFDQQRTRREFVDTDELQWQVPGHDYPVLAASVLLLLVLGVASKACS